VILATQVTLLHRNRPGRLLVDQLTTSKREARNRMSILWIILIVILVLALLGFFSRGYW
jgi:hypothetical protein